MVNPLHSLVSANKTSFSGTDRRQTVRLVSCQQDNTAFHRFVLSSVAEQKQLTSYSSYIRHQFTTQGGFLGKLKPISHQILLHFYGFSLGNQHYGPNTRQQKRKFIKITQRFFLWWPHSHWGWKHIEMENDPNF